MMTNGEDQAEERRDDAEHWRGDLGVEALSGLRDSAPDDPDCEEHDSEREAHRRK